MQQGELWGLSLNEFTVAEMFQEYGYKTHAVGKWHLGWRTWRHTPIHRGFDSFLGFYFCAHDHFQYNCGNLKKGTEKKGDRRRRERKRRINKNTRWWEDVTKQKRFSEPKIKEKFFDLRENWFNEKHVLVDKLRYDLVGKYSANVFTDAAIDKIENRGEDPFFIYLNYMGVHSPYQAPKYYVDKYTGHMWGANKDRKNYAAMMSSMDEGIGNITKTLIAEGIYNNTIIVFASDNGANVGYCSDADGNLTPTASVEPGSNYPLRGGKRSIFEGGIKSVSFVHSPLLKGGGRVMKDLVHVVDWFSTFEDIISDGFTIPRKYRFKDRNPLDSISAWRAIKKGANGKRKKFLINIDTRGSIKCGPSMPFKGFRKNQWKLIVGGGGPPSGWYSPYGAPISSPDRKLPYLQLYNILLDPSETFNLANAYPEIVLELIREINVYGDSMVPSMRRKKIDITPWLNGRVPTPLELSDPRNNETLFEAYHLNNNFN